MTRDEERQVQSRARACERVRRVSRSEQEREGDREKER